VVELLDQNAANLGTFITRDPKGVHIPAFLATLAENMASDQQKILQEMELLAKNIEHVGQ